MAAQQKWLLAEGQLAGKPVMIRAQRMEPLPVLPNLLVVDVFYDSVDETGLPGDYDYGMLERFEAEALERGSEQVRIVPAFVETHDGRVRYFCYSSHVDLAVEHIDAAAAPLEPEYSTEYDPDWDVYRQRMAAFGE